MKLIPLLKQSIEEMKEAACLVRNSLQNPPEGSLRVSPHRGKYQYYHVTEKSKIDGSKGEYIAKERMGLARLLAQKVYNKVVADAFDRGVEALEGALLNFHYIEIENCFDVQGEGRHPLINSAYLPNDVYANRWQSVEYQSGLIGGDGLFVTSKGEHVRSKSEVIIANTLNQLNIPYRYEYPLRLSTGRIIYPDFKCLNVRTRDEFIWEHFGLMNDFDYQLKTFRKLDDLAMDGYFHGVNLIYTMENDVRPLNSKVVELMAKKFLL